MGVETATEIGRKAARWQEEGWEERWGFISSEERLITNTINFYFDFGVNNHYTSWGGEGALMQLIDTSDTSVPTGTKTFSSVLPGSAQAHLMPQDTCLKTVLCPKDNGAEQSSPLGHRFKATAKME